MKVLFFNPPKFQGKYIQAEECCWKIIGRPTVPYQLLATATWTKQLGHEVVFRDFGFEDKTWEDVFAEAKQYDYVVTSVAHLYEPHYVPLAKIPNLIIIVIPEGYASQFAHTIKPVLTVWHDPEYVISQFFQGRMIRQPVKNPHFQEIPPIDYALYPYHYPYHPRQWKNYIIQATRDCVYRCNFCVWGGSTLHTPRFIMRTPKCLIEELHQIETLKGVGDTVTLLASELTPNLDWLRQFVALKREICPDLVYYSDIGVGELTEEKISLLIESRLADAVLGIEALSDGWLKRFNKPWTYESIKRGLLLLQKIGLPYHIILRCGVGETVEEITESMRHVTELVALGVKPSYLRWGKITPYAGTVIAPLAGKQVFLPELKVYVDHLRKVGWIKP